jgi:hypothetical protein
MTPTASNSLNRLLYRYNLRNELTPQDLSGWTPIKLQFREEELTVTWLNLQNIGFAAHRFFQQTVKEHTASRLQQDRLVVTAIDPLLALPNISPGLKPTGFIFHVSRCGSTLLSNMLTALSRNLVLVEPGPINKILASPHKIPEKTRCDWLQALISALGQPLFGIEQNYFIKFSSWNLLHWPLIRTAFPKVPIVFVYREPVEVIVSQLNNPGGWMRAQRNPHSVERRVQLPAHEIGLMNTEVYCARVLGKFYAAAARYYDNNSIMVNYNQLSEPLLRRILSFFDLEASEDEVKIMMDRMQFYSKDPTQQQLFKDDHRLKQMLASPTVRALANKWVVPHYEKLEATKVKIV